MTKRSLAFRFRLVMGIYAIAILGAVAVRIYDTTTNAVVYTTYKDLLPLVIAIPAVWLGHCLQRRASYLQQLRAIWSHLIDAIQSANQFMHLDAPTQDDYVKTLSTLSIAIDEIRGVFMNLRETPNKTGLYPFEPIKQIHEIVLKSGYSPPLPAGERQDVRNQIFQLWRAARKELLREFDREEPTYSHSHYAHPEQDRIMNWPPKRESAR